MPWIVAHATAIGKRFSRSAYQSHESVLMPGAALGSVWKALRKSATRLASDAKGNQPRYALAERMPHLATACKRSVRHWAEGLPWQSPRLPIPDNAPPSKRLVLEPHSWKESWIVAR